MPLTYSLFLSPGLHRYVILIFKQPEATIATAETRLPASSPDGRGAWNPATFISKYNLGDPVAGNFVQAEWDDFVPIFYSRFK